MENDAPKKLTMEESLRESEERLELVLEAASEGIWDWDILNGKTYASKRCSEIFGVTENEEFPGVTESWAERIHPDDYNDVSTALKAHLEGKGPFDVVYRHRHESGEYRWQAARGMALFDEDGAAYRMVGAIRDITEQKKAWDEKTRLEAKLQQARKIEALGRLANGIAHDFNNLLTAIMGNIDLSLLYSANEEKFRTSLDRAKSACKRAKDLTRQVITFAKGINLNKRTNAVDKFIETCARMTPGERSTKFEFIFPQDLWPVSFDPEQMTLVITNLVSNASEAMEGKGVIIFSAQNCEIGEGDQEKGATVREVRISIKDSGRGMDRETLDKIFDPYFSSKEDFFRKGMGLGLSMCYSIIENHGGHIEVESEVGVGTTFHLYIPAAV